VIPGEIILGTGDIKANEGLSLQTITVENAGDRPIQVGSHFHFFEVNRYLRFDRSLTWGMHLNIPSGTATRFEPGERYTVEVVAFSGQGPWSGGNNLAAGSMDKQSGMERAKEQGFIK